MKKPDDFTMKLDEGDINFRATLALLMSLKKVTVAKLAREAGLNYGTVFHFLKGTSSMGSSNLCKLFNILNKMEGS